MKSAASARCRILSRILMLAVALTLPAQAAERDICENKAGAELIRCIEAAARGPEESGRAPSKAATPAAKPATPASRPAPAAVDIPTPPVQDCTGLSPEPMRRCLAAGGRLAPEAAVSAPSAPSRAAPERTESCEGTSG